MLTMFASLMVERLAGLCDAEKKPGAVQHRDGQTMGKRDANDWDVEKKGNVVDNEDQLERMWTVRCRWEGLPYFLLCTLLLFWISSQGLRIILPCDQAFPSAYI